MLDYLRAHKQTVQYIDVNTPSGQAEFKKATAGKNIRGIPFSINTRTQETISGYKEIFS
jgi:hypothetical protein